MNGYEITTLVLGILLLVAGGYIRLLAKEIKELISTITLAIEDNAVDEEELVAIIKEATDVKNVILRIVQSIVRLVTRKTT